MTWIEDLSPCYDLPYLRAVGWLSRDEPFPTGNVPEEWFEKLCQLLGNPWNPGPVTAGVHFCDLCQFTGSGSAFYKDYCIRSSSGAELYIPGNGFLYVAPVSIAHYIDAHGYLPPEEFCRAVLECPPMRSLAYLRAVLRNGGRDLMRLGAQASAAPMPE